jgi:hypothetical protein
MRLFQQIDPRSFVYRVDARGRLASVNDSWISFACENGWPISRAEVVGRPLMSFIADEHLRYLYGLLMARLRNGHGPIRFCYRCDAPDCRRFMEMTMLHDTAQNEIELQSRVLYIERRTAQELLRPDHAVNELRVDLCSCCKRIAVEQDWVEVEDAVMRLRLFDSDRLPRTRHCVCPECSRQLSGIAAGRLRASPRSASR